MGFFLLFIAVGMMCGATAGQVWGVSATEQIIIASLVSLAGCVLAMYIRRGRKPPRFKSQEARSPLSIGATVTVQDVDDMGHARVTYSGALWEACAHDGSLLVPGTWQIQGNDGNKLLLTRAPISSKFPG